VNANPKTIKTPNQPELAELCRKLHDLSTPADSTDQWPQQQLELCGKYGVFRWFVHADWGGLDWNQTDIIYGYMKLAAACLKTTFVITQRTAACSRIAASQNQSLQRELLPGLASGQTFATVGISHLTTSHRYLAKPVLRAQRTAGGYQIDGFSPWVTGGSEADQIVMGAEMDDGRQILFALPARLEGVSVDSAYQLVALTGSQTGAVRCDAVKIPEELVLAGPVENVLASGTGGSTGGIQTSTLALGLARAAIDFVRDQSLTRVELSRNFESLHAQHATLTDKLIRSTTGELECSKDEIRTEANSLVLRATQSALVAAKGAGFVKGHPVGRWCQEALFFLVWSCPQPVLDANLCELAGIVD
jgi:alkylation response protein AidB-like acyl-CoA dehydrogenase